MNRSLRFITPVAVLLLSLAAGSAHAGWSNDVYANTPVSTAAASHFDPQILADGAGGVFVVWWDIRAGGSDYNVYGQHYDAIGRELWAHDGVLLAGGAGVQGAPRIIKDELGGFWVAWLVIPNISFPTQNEIRVQRFDVNGAALLTAGGVLITNTTAYVADLKAVADGQSGIVVVWTDDRAGGVQNLYAQKVKVNGLVLWTAGGVTLRSAAGDASDFDLCADPLYGTYVAWRDFRGANADVYTNYVDANGLVRNGTGGLAICLAADDQSGIAVTSDEAHGEIVAWTDARLGFGSEDVYAQHVTSAGPQWNADGLAVITASGPQGSVRLLPDGANGAFVVWGDARIAILQVRAQRLGASGYLMWTPDGVVISSGIGAQVPELVSDGARGFITVFQDFRDPNLSFWAQRVDANGTTLWTTNGVPLTRAPGTRQSHRLASDGRGGVIAVWQDYRNSSGADIYAERLESFGYVGVPEPVIASVLDVASDQGGKIKVSWYGSWPELPPNNAIDYYNVFRSVPASLLASLRAHGARLIAAGEDCATGDCVMATPNGTTTDFWEYVGRQDAFDLGAYSYLVPTLGDSVAGSNPRTKVMVQARSSSGPQFWSSYADSGYSVDDLAPATPSPFTGAYAGGTTTLHWGANLETDLAGYRLHRGTGPAFVPAPSNLVAATTLTDMVDPAGGPFYYKVAAIDVHGNLSGYALVLPNGTTDASPGALPREFALAPVTPNPARGATSFRFALPAVARVRLAVFDAQGREVRRIADGEWPAGEHALHWDGRDARGATATAGLYFVRFNAAGHETTRRFALLN